MGVRPLVLCRLRVWDRPNLNRVPYNTRGDRHQRIGWVGGNQRPVRFMRSWGRQSNFGTPGTVGCQWKSPAQSPYAARGRQRSYRP